MLRVTSKKHRGTAHCEEVFGEGSCMSRTVIRDVVIPFIQRIMQRDGIGPSNAVIQDPALEEFLEEAMRRYFGVIGANDCQHLKEQLEEAIKNDPYAFEYFLRQLLQMYVKLQVKIRQAEKKQSEQEGPPDRFAEQRRKYRLIFNPAENSQEGQ
jgi:hypothetical protein